MWIQRVAVLRVLLIATAAGLSGCAKYVTPGRGADLNRMATDLAAAELADQADPALDGALAKRPLARFPTGVAVARVQAPGYWSPTAEGYGTGNYSVVTTRDIEKDEQIERLARLPMIKGIAPINRLLLPSRLESDLQLRQAAAKLHADMLLIYTLDTTFFTEDKAAPLTVISLGLSPNREARVTTTVSAVLMDTRNGYIYGVSEATEKQTQLTSAWTSKAAIDQTRRRTESKAFEKLVGELEQAWPHVVAEYHAGAAAEIPGAGAASGTTAPSPHGQGYQTRSD